MGWKVVFYETPSGQLPVEDYIRGLQASTKAKLLRQLELLEEYGPALGMPNAKPLGGGLYELRVRGKEEVRSIYVYHYEQTIIVLHAFKKKTFAISNHDLNTARNRQRELKDNNV